jgi:hypothetical protein
MDIQTRFPSNPTTPSRYVDAELKQTRSHEDAILDEALAATFPCSDPVSTLTVDRPPPLLD